MDVHLITIKVSIKGRATAFIEPQGIPFLNICFKSHDTNSMQTWLSIEEDDVSILEVPLHNVTYL